MKRTTRLFRQVSGLFLLPLAAGFGITLAADGNLPAGTPISVEITSPADGAVIVFPPGNATLTGDASVGMGVAVPNTLLVYTLDVSFSTIRGDGGTGCGGDQNNDSISDTILDCEIVAAKELNDTAVNTGTVGQVGVAVFGGFNSFDPNDNGGSPADVGPGAGAQLVTGPATDANGSGGRDVEQVLNSAFSIDSPSIDGGVHLFTDTNVGSNGTNFAAGLEAAVDVAAASDRPNKIIVYMSDGLANTGPNVSSIVVPAGVVIKAFAIGSISDCSSDPNGLGSLDELAAQGASGSECIEVPMVADLPDVVPGIVASQLLGLELSVSGPGGPFVALPNSEIDPDLPQNGPASVTFSHPLTNLAEGDHMLCVRANGSDGGGTASVTDCVTITVIAPKLSIDDVSVDEGDSGTTPANFTVSLAPASPESVTITYATANGTANAPGDYIAVAATPLTFAPGETTKTVTVDVVGDILDEPNETFTVNLSNVTGATIADGQGVGTIVDDDRDGVFSCRASVIRIGSNDPVVANNPNVPCKDDDSFLARANLSAGLLSVKVNGLEALTDQTPDDLESQAPAVGDQAQAKATVASVTISTLLLSVKIDLIESQATARCVAGPDGLTPQLSGSSKVAGLSINGVPVNVGSAPLSIPLLVGTLHLNNTVETGDTITQRAVFLDAATDVVIAESKANFEGTDAHPAGNPCQQ